MQLGNAKASKEDAEVKLQEKNEEIEQLREKAERRKKKMSDLAENFTTFWLDYLKIKAEVELRRERHPTDAALQRALDQVLVEYAKNPPKSPI